MVFACTEMAKASAAPPHLPTFKWGTTRQLRCQLPPANNHEDGSETAATLRKRDSFFGDGVATREKRKREKAVEFTLEVTRGEIEKDFLAMTGAKPPRRPQRRPNAVQAEIESLFPGSTLPKIVTADHYKVPKQKSSD